MTDNYDYIHQASNDCIADMLEVIDTDEDMAFGERQEIINEAARRLRIPPNRTFYEEYMGEV